MRPDNRFEEYFQKLKRRKITVFFVMVSFLLVIEIMSICILYINMSFKRRNTDLFFYQYDLTDIFITPFLEKNHWIADSKQKFIGILTYTGLFNNWSEFLPPDTILGWRNGKSIKAIHDTLDRAYIYLTNEQGFLSIGETEFYVSRKKQPNTYRIFVVGGSTVMGQGAITPDENLPAQILRELKFGGGGVKNMK